MERISGAMTNTVFRVVNLKKDKAVIVRIFGPTEGLFDRKTERHIFLAASSLKIGAKCLFEFGNGRVEDCIKGNSITPSLMRIEEYACAIAVQLVRFHVLMSNSNCFIDGMQRSEGEQVQSELWGRLRRWLDKVRKLDSISSYSTILEEAEQQIESMSSQFHDNGWLAVCHNDLQYGNILLVESNGDTSSNDEKPFTGKLFNNKNNENATDSRVGIGICSPKLCLIDYEYSQFGNIEFDVANHFAEYAADYSCGSDLNWDLLPTDSERMVFCVAYMRCLFRKYANSPLANSVFLTLREDTSICSSASNGQKECSSSMTKYEGADEDALIEEAAKELLYRTSLFLKISHLHWGLWGLLFNEVSGSTPSTATTCEFDYQHYAMKRLEQFHLLTNKQSL